MHYKIDISWIFEKMHKNFLNLFFDLAGHAFYIFSMHFSNMFSKKHLKHYETSNGFLHLEPKYMIQN